MMFRFLSVTRSRPVAALRRLSGAVLLGLLATQAIAQIDITTPSGGWRYTPSTQRDFVQEVHYPAARVNVTGLGAAAQIAGRIAATPKPSPSGRGRNRPAALVVDGVALPLEVGPDGRFARPWAFGAGSHGVEVRAEGARRRLQFFEANPDRRGVKLRIVLSWDTDMTDLDLHVISPDGQHVFYGNRVAPNGGALDVDVTTGFGPEIYAHPNPPPGLWQVLVNYYGAGEPRDDLTVAQLAVIEHEGTLREKRQLFRVPLRKPGELMPVSSFLVAALDARR